MGLGETGFQMIQLFLSASRIDVRGGPPGGSLPHWARFGIFESPGDRIVAGARAMKALAAPGSGTMAPLAGASRASEPERQWHSRPGSDGAAGSLLAACWQQVCGAVVAVATSVGEQHRKTGLVSRTRRTRVRNRALMESPLRWKYRGLYSCDQTIFLWRRLSLAKGGGSGV